MGSPLGPLMVNTFMCSFKKKLESEDKLPSFYKRYMDDTLAVVKDIPTATAFLTTLNEAHRQSASRWKLQTTTNYLSLPLNQQRVVYIFKCDMCDADYVGYTCRHLFQGIEEHKHYAIGKHLRDAHNQKNKDLQEQFTILKKCGKFECLIPEMLFIQGKKPELNTQSDSIKAKLFSTYM